MDAPAQLAQVGRSKAGDLTGSRKLAGNDLTMSMAITWAVLPPRKLRVQQFAI
jgi:hypothetical protein